MKIQYNINEKEEIKIKYTVIDDGKEREMYDWEIRCFESMLPENIPKEVKDFAEKLKNRNLSGCPEKT